MCDITGRTRTTGNSRTTRAKGNTFRSLQERVCTCVSVCVGFMGCLQCFIYLFLFYYAPVCCYWCEKNVVKWCENSINFCWEELKQFLCPLHCDHCFFLWLSPFAVKTLRWRGTEWGKLDGGICWIYGAKSLTLITDTFSLLRTKMSAIDYIYLFNPD